ncbi:hypothetical protein J5N97_015792 [Dioscorea zingiberensis]|uniref:Ubiquitin conjugation factor E4 core domain-containing protein n=1 Tax=Dioscorea zingiberensis TaxID=325984 RepID=A0A9D5CJR9_9LILI|nr:hypothetical protein J5N97_015792 [Dioscorea zingiberensis]
MDAFGGSGSGVMAPPGFLEEFFRNGDYESLDPLLLDLYERLRGSVVRVSALGDFQRPLRVLLMLIGYQTCAKGLVNHPKWIPKISYPVGPGRMMEISSILGAFFHVSALPDYRDFKSNPDVGQLTAMHASSEEVAAWVDGRSGGESSVLNSQEASSSGTGDKYPFICECFFMTSRVLNLGLMKAFSDFKHLVQDLSRCEEDLSNLKAMRDQGGTPQLEEDIKRLENEIEMYSQEKFCYEAQVLRDGDLLQRALSFYRLVVKWLVGLVGGFKMPLPSNCPMEFACMPEHFVEDAMDLLILTSRIPRALDGFVLDDFLNFIIMFMASPSYVKNPYLRAKMVEVLNCWMPQRSGISATASLFEGHQLSLDYLVHNLLKLYVDIEFTGSHTQFFDKFTIRHNIAELLEYLWNVPSHRNTWMKIARDEEKGVYLNFLNFLINDSIYLLDESLNKILELKELEAEMSNSVEWERRSAQEREERMPFHLVKILSDLGMKLANEDVGMLALTSEQIPAPFLLPEMVERVASMLNYFLLQLVGPQSEISYRGKILKNMSLGQKQLLKQIVEIYVHIARGDREGVFPSAISKDGSCLLQQQTFCGKIGENAKYTLMKDPVILPSSRVSIDRKQ